MKRHLLPLCSAWLLMIAFSQAIHAEVNSVQITKREDVLDGRQFGAVGAYEWLAGRVYFTLDPGKAGNAGITDLKLAPRDARGLVEFWAELVVLRPKDPARANGVVLLDLVNRGRPTILGMLNRAAVNGLLPDVASYFGDGFLMKQGYTIVWLGWEQDLPPPSDLLHLFGPTLKGVTGPVYEDIQVPARVTDVSLANRGMTPYAVADIHSDENRLTQRASTDRSETLIPRDQWTLGPRGQDAADPTHLHLNGGFSPGVVYRFVYLAKDPYIAGLGLAAVRDLISWIRFEPNGLMHATHAYAFGISQDGRLLRQFLHDGFNADLAGRQVFDGMMIHIGGGSSRGFNERFAQPSEITFSRVFPFTDAQQTDPDTGEQDGLLAQASKAHVVPKIIYTSSSHEYWGGLGSAIHTTIDGKRDMTIPETSRVYLLASTEHLPAAFPPQFPVPATKPPVTGAEMVLAPAERGQLKPNPLDYRPVLRALFVALDEWVRQGTLPPASRVPRIADGTLVVRSQLDAKGFGKVSVPASPTEFFRLDAGEKTPGLPTINPPHRGKAFVSLVPQVDEDGNDLAGIRLPELAVPLATYTGWNLRDPSIGAPTELIPLMGSYLPFARTRAEREQTGDTRLSIEERYSSVQYYLGLVAQSAAALVEQRLLLPEDVYQVLADAEAHWRYVVGN